MTWSTYINTNGLEGVSVNNATVDSNKVAFRFRATTNCDGPANSGEVEDYLIRIACSQICLPIDIEIKKE